ncbi:hypothetical protein FisN_28Lh057 [Fistulifera solaris]|uniref:MYND-type domain-containing protein n=1 Tax=Fistulifera solaris TaxID=1519565 RepID=A0A1Z5KSG6_FISSO|nr:hypothetical protein FisN_28Lh057 [Fistulifera solaris]|eukprot:GAX29229.1 hypothetical protein FisN_28Lh057 [Fistulifera solaris]
MDSDIDYEIARLISSQVPLPGEKNWFKMPYYEGKNQSLKEPHCFACHDDTNIAALKRCSRCEVAWYCGRQCQKKHFRHHRVLCNQIYGGREATELAAIPLRQFIDSGESDHVENYVGRDDGGYNGYEGFQNWMRARSDLASMYWDAAYESEVREVCLRAHFHCVELMKFDAAFDVTTRIRLPFILLYLNRDDEAYAFIRYWLKVEDYTDPVYDKGKSWHGRSEGGDLPIPCEPNCRFNDIFEECTKLDELTLLAPCLMVLIIIKLRIIATHEAVSAVLRYTFAETACKRIQQVGPVVHEMLAGGDVSIQRQQLEQLFDKMEVDHPSIIDDLLECEFISERREALDLDEDFLEQYPFPINITLANGLRLFYRVPGAGDILRQRN